MASVEGSMTSAFMSARTRLQRAGRGAEPRSEAIGRRRRGRERIATWSPGLRCRRACLLTSPASVAARRRASGCSRRPRATQASLVEARSALVLIYSREGRHADAYRLLGELVAAYPRNRLFVLEQGSAAIRAGKHAEAEAILSAGLQALDRDTRPRFPGERALWLYKRGLARFGRDRRADATADFRGGLEK